MWYLSVCGRQAFPAVDPHQGASLDRDVELEGLRLVNEELRAPKSSWRDVLYCSTAHIQLTCVYGVIFLKENS